MFRIKLAKDDTKIPFLSYRKIAMVFSVLLMAGSLGLFFTKGVNLGIDFVGGIKMKIESPTAPDLDGYRRILADLDLGEVKVTTFGPIADNTVQIQLEAQQANEESGESAGDVQQAAIAAAQAALNAQYSGLVVNEIVFIGPKVSSELATAGFLAISLAVLAVLVYIWFRFEWHFGVGAVAALVHDVILTIGFFVVTGLEFDLSIIAAILTIVGYSLNDTVVVFDRVRENMRKYASYKLEDVLNMSLNQTLSRTLMTSVTTLIALFALFFLGGAALEGFVDAMIWGVFVGTYSSVFIASPVLLMLGLTTEHVALDAGDNRP